MTTIIRCDCEAVYQQVEIEITDWVEDSADCQVCGHLRNSWRGHKALAFDLINNPTE